MADSGYRGWSRVWIALWIVVTLSTTAFPQDYNNRLGQQRGGKVTFEPLGPGVFFDALDPTVKRWYVPQELYHDYRFRTWEYSNYARDRYERYVNTTRKANISTTRSAISSTGAGSSTTGVRKP